MAGLRDKGILLFASCCLLASATAPPDESYFTDDFLLATEMRSTNIYQVALNGSTIKLPIHAINPMGAVYDPLIQKVFWISQIDGTVKSSYLNFTDQKLIKRAKGPEGITIDPDEQLIFYTDGGLRTINLVTYDGKNHLQIVVNANHPRGVEADRMNKKIYWTDWGMETIEMADYDGKNRKVFITRPHSWMNGLAIDIEGRKLYWTDAKDDRLERVNLDGTHLETLLRHNNTLSYKNGTAVFGQGEAHYFGVAVDEQNIYFSDWMRPGIYQAPINRSGSAYEYIRLDIGNTTKLNGISIYKSSNYYTAPPSPCKNHRCSHLCIPLLTGYRCACPDMRRFDPYNNHTCSAGLKANGPDIVWVEHDGYRTSYLRGVKGDPKEYLRIKHIRLWSWRSPSWKWTTVEVNYRDGLVYLYDSMDRYFVQVALDGTMKMKLLNFGSSSQVNGLAYDWLSNNLYWTDSLYNWIAMMKPRTNYTRTLIEDTLDKPHGIAVYPQKGLMFWTDWGAEEKIQQANLDGTNIVDLVTTELYKPMGITVDYTKVMIYWTNTQYIESYDLTTKIRVKYGRRASNTFIDVTVYQNFIFATDRGYNETTKQSTPTLWFYDFDSFDERGTRLQLQRRPYGITMYAPDRQKPDAEAPCAMHNCSQLCVPIQKPTGFIAQCLCQDEYTMSEDGTCKPTPTSKGAMYVYALVDRICAMPIKKLMKKNLREHPDSFCFFNHTTKGYKFRAVDFNYREGEIYFSEYGTSVKTIRRARLEKKSVNSVLVYGTGDVRGLVVDWMTSNMYWTDATAGAIWVSKLGGQYMRKLVTDISHPGAVALDMQTKRLFWTESSGNQSRVMVAKLDGSQPATFVSVIVKGSNSTFTSLSVDYVEERIYWVNPTGNSIWSASLIDGSGAKMQDLVTRRGKIYGVTVMQDFIGFTESSTGSGSIHVAEKESGKELRPRGITHDNRQAAYDIVAYYRGNQPLFLGNASSSCAANGGCKQLCFPMLRGRTCGCTDSMKVSSDGVSCEPSLSPLKDKFFLIADDYRRQIYQADENLENIRALKFPRYDRPIGLTYDFVSDRVFWADFSAHVVKTMFLNGSDVKTLFVEMKEHRTEGLAFDPASQLLYYTDSKRNIIRVMNPTARYHKTLVHVLSPRGIVLDPKNGHMYVTSRSTGRGRILRYTMDGKNETLLIGRSASYPNGLDIDFKKKKMYWCDAHTERIESADINGTNRKLLYQTKSRGDPFDVAVHNGYVYWTDWILKGLFRIREDGTGMTILGKDLFSGLNDIKYFSKADRSVVTNCSINNGNCSHFCLPTASDSHVCACPDLRRVSVETKDGRNCPNVPACPAIPGVTLTCTLKVGAVCDVKCQQQWSHPTVARITCLKGHVWNADIRNLCEADKTCPLLVTPANTRMACHGHRRPGEFCTYTCFPNATRVSGSTNRTCTSGYTWTGTPLTCKLKTCLGRISNGFFKYTCNRFVNESCEYKCAADYKKTQTGPLKCQSNQHWNKDLLTLCTMKTCPKGMKNGEIDGKCPRYIKKPCDYTCSRGYKKTSKILKCRQNEKWDPDVNTLCELKSCPNVIKNGRFDPSCNLHVATSCAFFCKEGYNKTYSQVLECSWNATWNVDTSSLCAELLCPVPVVPKNAQVSPSRCAQPGRIGDDCNFSCNTSADYVNGTRQRKCLKNLTWSGTPIECKLKTCPSFIQNGRFDPSCKLYVGTSCAFSCIEGFKKTVNDTLTCKMDATWSRSNLSSLCIVPPASGGQPSAARGRHRGTSTGVTVGVVIIVLLLLAVAVAALFLVWRRRQAKTRSEYRESSPMNNNGTPSYSVGEGNVNLDGSVAFDNPVYGALPGSQPGGATEADVSVEVVTTPEQTACSNPLFDVKEKDTDTTDKKLLLDEDFVATTPNEADA